MYKDAMRAAWTEISLTNLDYNIKQLKEKVKRGTKITAVIKADAYGHGAVRVASVLRANNINSFGVATLGEAARLRNSGFLLEEIVILGPTPEPLIGTIIQHRLSPVVSSYENAEAISKAAAMAGIIIKGYIAVDTGMGRIGFNPDDSTSIDEIRMIDNLPNFKIQGIFSHLATADEEDKTFASVQEQRFNVFNKRLVNAGVKVQARAIANSAAIMDITSTHYEMCQLGIVLYGIYPSEHVDRHHLSIKPVMSVKANIIELRKVPAGTSIGYGRKFVAKEDSIIATIPIGYGDGLPRAYSRRGKVIVNGVFAPFAGMISMDLATIDVTRVPYVRLGDEVTVMGSDGMAEITAYDIAATLDTISYEITCGFGARLPKVYTY